MPRFDLPSGGWVEYRDKLKGRDQTVVQDELRVIMDPDVQQEMGMGVINRMHNRLLDRIITAWSYEEPIPSSGNDTESSDEVLELDDYNALKKETEPLMDKVNFTPPPQPASA